MSKILAIETATEACSAALLIDDVIVERFKLAPREHTKLLLPMMDEVLEEASVELKDIDAIAFSRGPGAFTGLRISAGVAQGAALSVDKPVIPVSTLAALALQAAEQNKQCELIIAALDARMGEVYWGAFRINEDRIQIVGDEQLSKPEEMMAKMSDLLADMDEAKAKATLIGPGWDAYQGELFKAGKPKYLKQLKDALPRAEHIARLALPLLLNGKAVPVEEAQPIYIRNNVAKKSKKIKN